MKSQLQIVQVNAADIGGGAYRVGFDLFHTYRRYGHNSWLVVGNKFSTDPNVLTLPKVNQTSYWASLCRITKNKLTPISGSTIARVRYLLQILEEGWTGVGRELGHENFRFPGSRQLLKLVTSKPDIIHAHNLHANYFDLRWLPYLSQQQPLILTLHDAWLLSGHCAHSFACERWRIGCGNCPDLKIHPAIRRDATAFNWQRKRKIYQRSKLFIVTPSEWLMRKVEQSMLGTGIVDAKVIPNGVDTDIFCPHEQSAARIALGLPLEANVLLFVANLAGKNMFKDHTTLKKVVEIIANRIDKSPTIFIALGGENYIEQVGPKAEIRYISFVQDLTTVARYYQAADLYLHAAHAENFPLTVLEAMACGIPVIATAVGGIPEQIVDGITGYLTAAGDSQAMADATLNLLCNTEIRCQMGQNAREAALERFSLLHQADQYIRWYWKSIEQHRKLTSRRRVVFTTGWI